MITAEVCVRKMGNLLGLKRAIATLVDLEIWVEAGLPKLALDALARHVFGAGAQATAFVHKVIPSPTLHRREGMLKPQESERVERLARVIALAEHVWNDVDDARIFLSQPHGRLAHRAPIEVALTELGGEASRTPALVLVLRPGGLMAAPVGKRAAGRKRTGVASAALSVLRV